MIKLITISLMALLAAGFGLGSAAGERDHHTTEQSSAGDQGTVNESQDPMTDRSTPHDKMEQNRPKQDVDKR